MKTNYGFGEAWDKKPGKVFGSMEIMECEAIALEAGDTEPQKALFVHYTDEQPGDADWVVFGFEMPEDEDDVKNMQADTMAWSADWETLETVRLI